MKKTIVLVLSASLLFITLTVSGCASQQESTVSEGFAIYLTRDDIPVSQMPILSHVDIADEPIISIDDIVTYKWGIHAIELTPEAYERVDELEVSTSGRSFVVCVDKQPIYWGAFWAGYSSQSFDGVTIAVKPIFPGRECSILISDRARVSVAVFFAG